jgi:hypothetical protein
MEPMPRFSPKSLLIRAALAVPAAWAWLAVVASTAPSRAAESGSLSPELLASMSQMVRGILVESVPEKIEKGDNWGDTRARFSQLKVKTDGGKLRLEANSKEVKHGLWKQIVVEPMDPARNLRFRIVEARSTGKNTVAFAVAAASPLKLTAKVERWRTGVKLFNFSTDADASIEMRIDGELSYEFKDIDGKNYLTFSPTIKHVDLKLIEFDLRRLGPAEGQLVQYLGDMLSDPLADQLDRHEPKVAKKLNDAITKRQDKLRVPMSLSFDFGSWLGSTKTAEAEAVKVPTTK